MKRKDPVDKLERMYEMVSKVLDGVDYEKKNNHIVYSMDPVSTGKSIGFPMKKVPEIGVVDVCMDKGSISKEHSHLDPIREVFLVYKGKVSITLCKNTNCEKVYILETGDVHIIEPTIPHIVEALKETRLIAATMPTDKKYPNGN